MSSTLDVNKKSFTIALLGSWSSLTDLSRNGDAHKIEALANNISGAEDFSCECDKMLESLEVVGEKRKELAKNGFTHIAMGRGCCYGYTRGKAAKRAGQVDVVKEIGERLIGEEEFELKVHAKIAESGGI
ncbi:hypothetical protein Slin14017_G043030 [Septoria linicola]|nr:hypothetical protein Slin14017_G043030 [Septoria linicola]